VYLSIQAMILCEEPWYNEPGREAGYQGKSGDSPSARYNHSIREHTVRTAMLEWLDKTPSLWKDVLDQHFTANADKILHAAVEWSKSKIQFPSRRFMAYDDSFDDIESLSPNAAPFPSPVFVKDDLEKMLPRLQKALNKYGASQIVEDKPETAVSKGKGLSSEKSTTDQAPNLSTGQPHPLYQPPPHSMGFTSHLSMQDFSSFPPSYPGDSGFPSFTGGLSYFSGSRGRGGYRGRGYSSAFTGPGRTLGEDTLGPASLGAQSPSPRGRSGTHTGTSGSSLGSGRYETRSSTRGVRASVGAESPGRGGHSSVSGPSQGPDSPPPPPGRGGYHWAQARGSHGGQGDRSGRGGHGDRGGRGVFEGHGGSSQSDAFQ
jgi:hypothetical protein